MREKKQIEYLEQKRAGLKPEEVDADSSKLRDICLARVFKDYLPYVSRAYKVQRIDENYSPAESVASFDITKLVLEKNDKFIDKLKNVYHLLAYSDNSIALIVNRKHGTCKISLAVGTEEKNSEQVKNLAANVRDALMGNFPGSECSEVVHYADGYGCTFLPLNVKANFSDTNFNSVGIVSNIATDFSEEFATQGIEKLIDGIQPKEDKEYTIIILGKALSGNRLQNKKEELYQLYTAMSPFAKRNKSWGVNEGKNWSSNWNLSLFGNLQAGVKENNKLLSGIPVLGKTMPNLNSGMAGINAGGGHSWGGSVGASQNESVEITQYDISHTLEIVEKQMNRLEQCEALGLWNFAAYVFSTDFDLVNEVSHMYMSLTQGNESFYEKPSINIWNAQSKNGVNRDEINKIRSYVSYLNHPVFVKKTNAELTSFLNGENWPSRISCTSEVSGAELARSLNLPRTSVAGLVVIECAPFGREIASYDLQQTGDIKLGKIHHMHHDEKISVQLNSDSLTSHTFVTGSTGAGKSNTVYRLLSQANRNFLVIEPTKGEYRYVFGDDVYKFGTNHMMGEVLQVNPFVFPDGIHVYEHIDRLLEVFNVCWPMYAAMPAVLKDAIIRAYEKVGWDLRQSRNTKGKLYPTFEDVCNEIDAVIESSDYSDENKGNYRGSLKTRLKSLTNGVNGLIFCEDNISDRILFDSKTIVDLSRVGSGETKALIMGILVIKLQEYRMCRPASQMNEGLKHITVLEEAHHLLRNAVSSVSPEMSGGIAAKSVEMLTNAIAEMRTYGEGFVIVDQAPGLLDMAVIRNTNTKIIMRLPEQSDRELVGRAANLNDDQISELAKLQKGVAAVYQNEWVEPVLCHVDKHEIVKKNGAGKSTYENLDSKPLDDAELQYVNSCIFDPNYLARSSDINFIDCVARLEVSDSLKASLIEYARTPMPKRQKLYQEVAYKYFAVHQFMEESDVEQNSKTWSDDLITYIRSRFLFADDVDFSIHSNGRYIFTQLMIQKYVEWIEFQTHKGENVDRVDSLVHYMSDFKNSRIR